MPTYNRANFLPTSVESVLNQDFKDWELIIVDDGSKDETLSVAQSFENNRIRYIQQPNAGVSAARNTGIGAARGLYVCFLDDDDRYLKHHLSFLHSEIIKRSQPVTLISTNLYKDFDGKLTKNPYQDYGATNSFNILPWCQTSCIHNRILEKHLLNEGLKMREDHEFLDRIRQDFGIISLNEYTVVLKKHDDNFTANKYEARKGLEKTTHFYIWDRKRFGKEELIILHGCYLFLLIHYSRKRNVSKALLYGLKTLSILPLALFIKRIRSKYFSLFKKAFWPTK